MTHLTRKAFGAVLGLLFVSGTAIAGEWSAPAEVRHLDEVCVTYRAKLAGNTLLVEATHGEGWHTFAMDNEIRAKDKLAGKMSLGIDQPTEIALEQGLALAGPWRQTPPANLSKPELRWYSWGYEEPALFVARVTPLSQSPAPALIGVRGQACSATVCKNIDITLAVPPAGTAAQAIVDVGQLEQVRSGE